MQYLDDHGMSYDDAKLTVEIWERCDVHRDWWNVLRSAEVGDRLEGIDAQDPEVPFKRANERVYGYFVQGENAPFDFLVAGGKFGNNLASFYSDKPTDRYANIRVDIILGRPKAKDVNTFDFVTGTDNFAYNTIPELTPPNDANAIKGGGAIVGGILAIPIGWALSPAVGIPSSIGGVTAAELGFELVTDYLHALNIYNYQASRFSDYGPGNP